MTRIVAVLARPSDAAGCPAEVERTAYAAALLEDAVQLVTDLAAVTPALVLSPAGWVSEVDLPVWPGTPVLGVPAGESAALDALDVLAGLDRRVAAAAVVAGDAPDLPGLLVGKLFRALGRAEVAICPAAGGGLVALAARLPPLTWLRAAAVGLDAADAVSRLTAAAPRRTAVALTPGWHRLRTPADVRRLDPDLEGWDATRTLLAAARRPIG